MGAGPALRGTLLALASALAFGVTTPLVQRLGRGAGPFAIALLLYAGAALVGAGARSRAEAPLGRTHVPRLFAVALAGAAVAPALLAWGLARTSGIAASLMLNLEALFTIALARLLYREHVGRRVAAAALVLLAGGALLVLDRAGEAGGASSVVGLAAIAGAALAWAFDNALAKPLSALDPAAVVAGKGAIGAALSLGAALALREAWPPALAAAGLVLVGATGYGASLQLYLRAQRAIGAGRTASVFASGPFWGAALASALGEPASVVTAVSAIAMIAGLVLHLTERHGHAHVHEPLEHEHAHRHDDGHHDHTHEPMPEGEHTHAHRHERQVHDHPHVPDLHHDHEHADAHSHDHAHGHEHADAHSHEHEHVDARAHSHAPDPARALAPAPAPDPDPDLAPDLAPDDRAPTRS
ncbi:MAG: DMT family transporter [Labilithrix sp.]|nr:DMT family transporter [Labilithrix sp.]